MNALGATIISGSTLVKIVVGALVAGLGVTVAFSLLIYCADRAITAHRERQRTAAALFQAASALALMAVVGLIAFGIVVTVSKPG